MDKKTIIPPNALILINMVSAGNVTAHNLTVNDTGDNLSKPKKMTAKPNIWHMTQYSHYPYCCGHSVAIRRKGQI